MFEDYIVISIHIASLSTAQNSIYCALILLLLALRVTAKMIDSKRQWRDWFS